MRKYLTEKGHIYKAIPRNKWGYQLHGHHYRPHLGNFSGLTVLSSPTTSPDWELRSLPSLSSVTSRELGKLPRRMKRRGLCAQCPSHNNTCTWMIPGGEPYMSPWCETHRTRPCGGLGAQGEGSTGSMCVWSYLSVQPSFTFIFVFLKWNWSIRKGLLFACMHCTEDDFISSTWWLSLNRVATGVSQ